MHLQKTIGNQAVQRLIKSGALQAKLAINHLDIAYEKQAKKTRHPKEAINLDRPLVSSKRFLAHELTQVGRQRKSEVIQRARLLDFKDSKPEHDPSKLSDSDIEATNEYKAYMDQSLIWQSSQSQPKVKREEALLACRLILRDMRAGNRVIWKSQASDFILTARKQLGTLKEKPEEINVAKAIAENKRRLAYKNSVLAIQGALEMASPNGSFDKETVERIVRFQQEKKVFLESDAERGVVTEDLMKEAFYKLLSDKDYNGLIMLVTDYYLRDTYESLKSNIVKFEYDPNLSSNGEEIDFEITIGNSAFRYYEFLPHVIGHEFEHAKQKKERIEKKKKGKPLAPELGVDEFRARAFNILTERLPMKRFNDFVEDAKLASEEWENIDFNKVPKEDTNSLLALYEKVRTRVLAVFGPEKSSDAKELFPKIINVKKR